MPSKFFNQNAKIRKALARRAKEKGLELEEDAVKSSKYDLAPDEPGDGRIVRKTIEEDYDDPYQGDE